MYVKLYGKVFYFDYRACNRWTAIIAVICALFLCLTALDAYGGKDIDGYMSIPWGTDYSEMKELLEQSDEGSLGYITCPDYRCEAKFTRPTEFAGVKFERTAYFDKDKRLTEIRMVGHPTANLKGVYSSITNYTYNLCGNSDINAAEATANWSKSTMAWSRASGRMTLVHERIEKAHIITIIKKGG